VQNYQPPVHHHCIVSGDAPEAFNLVLLPWRVLALWLLFVYDVQRINPTHVRHGSIHRQLIGSLNQ